MDTILIVEDNYEFMEAAAEFLSSVAKPKVIFRAQDYDSAISQLNHKVPAGHPIDGIITDCFFPKMNPEIRERYFPDEAKDMSLGEKAIQILESADANEAEIKSAIEAVSKYAAVDDPLRSMLRGFISQSERSEFTNGPVYKAIAQVGAMMTDGSKEAMTLIIKNTLRGFEGKAKGYYGAMRAAMKESENNQPLGILVAQEAERRGIPFVLATSTHHHDILTQPIQNYALDKGWTLVDCGPNSTTEKSSLAFWQRAYGALQEKAKTKTRQRS